MGLGNDAGQRAYSSQADYEFVVGNAQRIVIEPVVQQFGVIVRYEYERVDSDMGRERVGQRREPGTTPAPSAEPATPRRPPASTHEIRFQNRTYQTLHRRERHEQTGEPIDLYYFPIVDPDGRQARTNGEPMWGRFVRESIVGRDGRTIDKWWHATWELRGGTWARHDTADVVIERITELRQ
jgi:hypothetical protein